jgi:hypothetical protein
LQWLGNDFVINKQLIGDLMIGVIRKIMFEIKRFTLPWQVVEITTFNGFVKQLLGGTASGIFFVLGRCMVTSL